jgi:hypothetical protein
LTEEKNKNKNLWSLECALQQGFLGFRFRVEVEGMFAESMCDINFDSRIQWEIVLRGK